MVFHSALRKAIAKAFPDRYSWLAWPKLLPDFVDVHIEAYLIKRDRFEKGQASQQPVISDELREAATLLAKQQHHAYGFLALSHYLMQWEVAAERRTAEHYRRQAEGYEQLMLNYKRLADQAVTSINHNEDPNNRPN